MNKRKILSGVTRRTYYRVVVARFSQTRRSQGPRSNITGPDGQVKAQSIGLRMHSLVWSWELGVVKLWNQVAVVSHAKKQNREQRWGRKQSMRFCYVMSNQYLNRCGCVWTKEHMSRQHWLSWRLFFQSCSNIESLTTIKREYTRSYVTKLTETEQKRYVFRTIFKAAHCKKKKP